VSRRPRVAQGRRATLRLRSRIPRARYLLIKSGRAISGDKARDCPETFASAICADNRISAFSLRVEANESRQVSIEGKCMSPASGRLFDRLGNKRIWRSSPLGRPRETGAGNDICTCRGNGECIYALCDTVTRLRRKDYKPQLQADVYAAAECSDPRSAESSSWMFSKCKPSCQPSRGCMRARFISRLVYWIYS